MADNEELRAKVLTTKAAFDALVDTIPEPAMEALTDWLNAMGDITAPYGGLLALASRSPSQGVAVKELEWDEYDRAGDYFIADTCGQNAKKYMLARCMQILGYFDDPVEAKPVAQADFEARTRSALASTAPDGVDDPPKALAEFGAGNLGIDTGTFNDKPAVFIRPVSPVGAVGARLPEEFQIRGPQAHLEPGEFFLTFPTMEQAERVADALVGPALSPVPAEAHADAGWRLVPVEPTPNMLAAGVRAGINASPNPWCPAVYRAMLAASPLSDGEERKP